MTLTEQVKIFNDKVKANQAQYDLDREAAKISALSIGELEKYEYFTGEHLGYKPDVIQRAKFEYSSLGKVFNNGLDEGDKKSVLKKLKNSKGKDEEQLKAIKEQGEKQLQILAKKTNEVDDFKNIYFENKLNSGSKNKLIMKLRNKVKKLNIQNLSALAHQLSIIIILPSL